MEHQIELAYLGIEVPDPDDAHAVLRRGRSASFPASRPATAPSPGATTTAPSGSIVQPGPGQRRGRSSASRRSTTRRSTRPSTGSRADRRRRRRGHRRRPAGAGGSTGWSAPRRRGASTSRSSLGLADAADAVRVAARAGRLPHRGRRLRARRVRDDRVRRVAPLPHRRPRARAVRLARDGDRRRASSSRCASTTATSGTTRVALAQGAVRAAADAAPRDVRDERRATTSAPRSTGRGRPSSPIPNGLGRHDNDGMFSFYVQTPGRASRSRSATAPASITDDWDDNRRYDRISAWGHQPLRQP